MEHPDIIFASYVGGGILSAALCAVFISLWWRDRLHFSLIIAAAGSAAWQLMLAQHYFGTGLPAEWLLLAEILHHGLWINALLVSLRVNTGPGLAFDARWVMQGIWIGALALAGFFSVALPELARNSSTLIWNGLLLSILGLVAIEQLYRNTEQQRLIKLLAVGVGAIFAYDTYLFSHSLIFNRIAPDLWQARGAVNGAAALLMAIGSLAVASQAQVQTARLAMSRPVVFYTTSLTVAGSFLALMALGGYYVQLYGGRWGTIIQITALFLALVAIVVVFVSRSVRSRLNVWINKHFFHHKYDYRVEWLRLIKDLSRPADHEDFHVRAVRAVASIFKSPGGGLWLRNSNSYAPVCIVDMELPHTPLNEPIDAPFCIALREHEWVFSPYSPDNHKLGSFNDLLPDWIYRVPRLWLVLPLLTESELLGFMVLSEPEHDTSLTWEDLDLLKTVGRQVASYLDRHDAAELLAESRQFDAFNKLAAFIMHDLKNLIAQQALVVENAARHRDNPAFFEDAIKTIDNSVGRMSNLLRKLQQNEPSELRSLELHKALMEAVKKCKGSRPVPSLRLEDTDLKINADQDRLIMTLTHIIKNAQEATDSGGFVDVTLRGQGNDAIITVEDNGVGMDTEFIRNYLFKPFVTTKSGKGMGIGVYQTRELISSLGGSVTVDSTPGEGTTFTITLPATQG